VEPSLYPAPVEPSVVPAPVEPSVVPALEPQLVYLGGNITFASANVGQEDNTTPVPALVVSSLVPAPVEPSVVPAPEPQLVYPGGNITFTRTYENGKWKGKNPGEDWKKKHKVSLEFISSYKDQFKNAANVTEKKLLCKDIAERITLGGGGFYEKKIHETRVETTRKLSDAEAESKVYNTLRSKNKHLKKPSKRKRRATEINGIDLPQAQSVLSNNVRREPESIDADFLQTEQRAPINDERSSLGVDIENLRSIESAHLDHERNASLEQSTASDDEVWNFHINDLQCMK
jgi:hypothetical protein